MKFQVFGCPGCQQPFQVAETQAGQVVQCPSCTQSVEIPKNAFVDDQQPAEQQVFACPKCSGQFGVTSDMFGQQVGCPHCQTSILIQTPDAPPEPDAQPEPNAPPEPNAQPSPNAQSEPVAAPEINIEPAVNKKEKKGTRWKSPVKPKATKDMFAPGFEKTKPSPETKTKTEAETETEADPPIQPVRRKVESKPTSGALTPPAAPKSTKRHGPSDNRPPPSKKRDPRFKTKKQSGSVAPPTEGVPQKKKDLKPPTIQSNAGAQPPVSSRKEVEAEVVSAEVVNSEVVNSEVVNSEVVDAREAEAETGSESNPETTRSAVINQPEPIDHLLPPRFDVLDPERMRFNAGKDQFKILLPDGKGGTKQVDQRVMRVEHGGEQVALVAMSDREKQRRKLIQNTIAIVIGIFILWIAFLLLR